MGESIERLSFELSTRALAEQERMLGGMRASAGTLIAAASVAASLRTPSTAHVSLGGVIALVACALSVGCAVWVLLPHGLRIALSLSLGCVLLLIEIVSLILATAW